MPRIITKIEINAPIQLAFDLSRSIDFHTYSQADREEIAISGVRSGLISLGESVTWKAKHFGFTQQLTAKITIFDSPNHFRDSMEKGTFKRFDHDHIFESKNGKTILTDIFDYDAPLGIIGKLADLLFLKKYMTKFSIERNEKIKKSLESDLWKEYIKE